MVILHQNDRIVGKTAEDQAPRVSVSSAESPGTVLSPDTMI